MSAPYSWKLSYFYRCFLSPIIITKHYDELLKNALRIKINVGPPNLKTIKQIDKIDRSFGTTEGCLYNVKFRNARTKMVKSKPTLRSILRLWCYREIPRFQSYWISMTNDFTVILVSLLLRNIISILHNDKMSLIEKSSEKSDFSGWGAKELEKNIAKSCLIFLTMIRGFWISIFSY